MKKDQNELIKYLDKKFIKVDKKFDNVDDRFDKIDKKIDGLEDKFDKKFDQLVTAIDKLAKSIEIYHDEQKALSVKVDQHEKWLHQMAEKLGMKLNY